MGEHAEVEGAEAVKGAPRVLISEGWRWNSSCGETRPTGDKQRACTRAFWLFAGEVKREGGQNTPTHTQADRERRPPSLPARSGVCLLRWLNKCPSSSKARDNKTRTCPL